MPSTTSDTTETIPLAEEVIRIGAREVVDGRVRVRTIVEERPELARADLFSETVSIERVLLDRFVDTAPEPRQEGDTLVIPIVEEVAVVEKRLMVREELRLTRVRTAAPFSAPVTLRATRAIVDRLGTADPPKPPTTPDAKGDEA